MIEIKNLKLQINHRIISPKKDLFFDSGLHFIKGVSGSGKTTLLYILGQVSNQTDFRYYYNHQLIESQKQKDTLKKNEIGFLYQNLNVIEHLTLYQNLELFANLKSEEMNEEIANNLLKKVKLNIELNRTITNLSGGEKQRFLLACILAKNPKIIIADEPTSALDKENADLIMNIFKELSVKENKIIILSTHTKEYDVLADSIYFITKHTIEITKSRPQKSNKNFISKKNKTSVRFFYKFIQQHLTFTIIKYKYVLLMSLLLLSFSNFMIQYGTHSQKEYKEILNQTVPTEMIVTFENTERFDNDISRFLKIDGIKNVFPIYKEYGTLTLPNHESIPVTIYPTFDSEKTTSEFKGNSFLYPHLLEEATLQTFSSIYNGTISEILGQNTTQLYTDEPSPLIFINSDLMDISQATFIGKYLLEIKSIEYYSMIKQAIHLHFQPLTIVSSYHNISQLLNSIESNQSYIYLSSITLTIISTILLIFIAYHESQDKYKELCIYQANGLSKKDMYILLVLETIIKLVGFTIICLLLSHFYTYIANSLLFKYFEITMTLNDFIRMITMILLILIIPFLIFNMIQLKKPIEKELRANAI